MSPKKFLAKTKKSLINSTYVYANDYGTVFDPQDGLNHSFLVESCTRLSVENHKFRGSCSNTAENSNECLHQWTDADEKYNQNIMLKVSSGAANTTTQKKSEKRVQI